jgi:cytochrome c
VLPVLWLHQQPATAEEKPPVPFAYGAGFAKYQEICAECHGQWADGTDQGPPLIHAYYVPSHHSDESFYRAILQGAKRHHWTFGDMEPVPSATMNDAVNITKFVRWLQQYRKLY